MQQLISGNIVTPDGVFYGELFIEDERISEIRKTGEFDPEKPVAVPGFVDIHFHGVGPFDMVADGSLEGIAAFEPQNGVTSFTPALASYPRETMQKCIRDIRCLMGARAKGSAVCAGLHLEGPWLDFEHRGGMWPEMVRPASDDELEMVVREGRGVVKIVTISPEIENGLKAAAALKKAGITVSLGHSGASPEIFARSVDAGVSHVCHLFDTFDPREVDNGVTQFCLADACLMDDRVTVEIIADGFHVPPELVKLSCRLAGADRVVIITDSMQGTGLPNGTYHQDDGTDYYLDNDGVCVRSDGEIVGSCLTMVKAFSNLVNKWGISLTDAARMTAANPAKVIGIGHETGRLAPGMYADINILAPGTLALMQCMVRGEVCWSAE